jgi:hypothetical protein
MPGLNTGLDRGDGIDGRIGTPTPVDAVTADGPDGSYGTVDEVVPIEELPDSPTIERAEQATLTHKFRMPWTEAVERIKYLPRGLIREDSFGEVYKLLSSTVQYEKGGTGILTTVDESVSFDNPPDQFQITPVELGVNIMKHPRYFKAFLGDGQGSTTEQQNQMVIRLLQDYMENPSAPFRNAISTILQDSIRSDAGSGTQPPQASGGVFPSGALVSGTDMAKRAALEIIQKYWRGEETPYVVGYQITWSSFYFRPPYLNPGGYIEDPIYEASPLLPDYFWSPDFPPTSATVFDLLDDVNPQGYSTSGLPGGGVSISWLRKADELDYERTWFKVTRTWIGSTLGHWDTELYSSSFRPQVPGDYLQTA